MTVPENPTQAFLACAEDALEAFPNTVGQCVSFCAAIAWRLTEDGVPNRVALGSLSCRGILAFQYVGPIATDGTAPRAWDGHAWIELPGGIIGEPSLFRTAKAAPRHSNLRRTLEQQGAINRGAFALPESRAFSDFGLRYARASYLPEADFEPLIRGLLSINPLKTS